MKLLLFLTLLPCALYSQTLDGFLGIKWGTLKADVIKTIKSRGGVINSETEDRVFANKLKFGRYIPEGVGFAFFKNRLCLGIVMIKSEQETQTIELYDEICDEISNKYFQPTETIEKYKYPFSKDDGDEAAAISNGSATISRKWEFQRPGINKGRISISVKQSHDIIITYINNDLFSAYSEATRRSEVDLY